MTNATSSDHGAEANQLHVDLATAKQHGDVTPNGVAFDWWYVNINGAGYKLLREPHHSDEDIEVAKRYLRGDHDVVTLRVASVPAEELVELAGAVPSP